MADLYLVDSSVWVRVFRKAPPERLRRRMEELIQANAVATCDIVKLELLRGVGSEAEFSYAQAGLEGLPQLSTGPSEWSGAARLGFSLRQVGVNIASPDLLVASVAISHGAALLHTDRHFELIREHSSLVTEPVFELLGP